MKFIFPIGYVLVGIIIGYFVFDKFSLNIPNSNIVKTYAFDEKRVGDGKLTNPLLECEGVAEDESVEQLHISKVRLIKKVDELINKGMAKNISVYVRDLNNGPWIGINEREEFIGASLLKLPILIAYYKKAQDDPTILDMVIDYNSKIESNHKQFTPSEEIEVGKSYTVNDLINYMIIYSDNNAYMLLASKLSEKEINETFSSIGLGSPIEYVDYPVNSKVYAGFFRILFNASYLNREYSERALELLTKVEFNKGITADLPKDMVVAHKYGERNNNETTQFHDCGIIYHPNHPYLICIMTKGNKPTDLMEVISSLSKFIFDDVRGGVN